MATISQNIQLKIKDENSNWVMLYPKTKAECVEGLEDIDFSNIQVQIDDINKRLDDIQYVPITITSFTSNKNTVEIGTTISEIILSWNTSSAPEHLYLNNTEILNTSKTYSYTIAFSSNKTFTLKAVDSRGTQATRNLTISFLNGAYYGVSSSLTYDNDFILGLSKTLTNSKNRTINVNAGVDQYIYYCIPSRFGTCKFTVNGFSGGFSIVDTISFTNASGYTEEYDIWKSTNSNLGNISVVIS